MSELLRYLRPRPAYEPIRTRGNAFWRGDERFFIKGIHYFQKQPSDDPDVHIIRQPKIDGLTSEHLPTLRQDIKLFQELGLNTIYVSALDPSQNHHEALSLLARAGIYVIVTLGEDIAKPDFRAPNFDPEKLDTQPFYHPERSLKIVDQLVDYPNILGFVLDGSGTLHLPVTTKMAEVLRAHVRDIKHFLRLSGRRSVPVGVSHPEVLTTRKLAVQYFTSKPVESRIDFFAPDIWSWIGKSSFQISGWNNQCSMLDDFPVPMFLNEYGGQAGKSRIWEEVECLYSRDMTGVFSGGCVYGFYEFGNGYGVIKNNGRKKREFYVLAEKMRRVNRKRKEEIWDVQQPVKDYEGWEGGPPMGDGMWKWYAKMDLPKFPMDWEQFMRELQEESEKALEQDGRESSKIGALSLAQG